MGMIHVTTTVRNTSDPDRTWQGTFLVDTGASDCMVPRQHLESIGAKKMTTRTYELADGSEVEYDVAGVELEVLGDVVNTMAIFGPDDAEPILGVIALEQMGIEVDPRTQRLKRLPSLRLKGYRTR